MRTQVLCFDMTRGTDNTFWVVFLYLELLYFFVETACCSDVQFWFLMRRSWPGVDHMSSTTRCISSLDRCSWEQADVLRYISYRRLMDAEWFGVLPEGDCDFHINNKGVVQIAKHGAYYQKNWIWWPSRRIELMTSRNLPFARDPGELVYAQSLDLHQEVLSGYLLVFRLSYSCFA